MKTSELARLVVMILLVVLFVGLGVAHCQAPLPETPQPFLTKPTVSLLLLDAAAKSADAYYTRRNVVLLRGVEQDPLVRPFAHNLGATVAWAGGFYTLDVLTAYELHRYGHDKLARGVLAVSFGLSAEGAAYSGSHP